MKLLIALLLVEQHLISPLPEGEIGRPALKGMRALASHVQEESSNVEKGSELRSKQVKKLEIDLRKLVKTVKDLQTVAPVEYVEKFQITAEGSLHMTLPTRYR